MHEGETLRLLVFGGGGQVGTALRRLRRPGLTVTALTRADADLLRPESVAAAVRRFTGDAVVNAAAYTAVDRAESEAETAFAVNRDGAAAVAAACAAVGLPLIHLSTDYVFDGTKPGPYVEDDPVNPLSVYGAGKAAGEEAVRAATDRHAILRTSWVFGGDGHNFVRTMLRVGETRDHLRVVDDQTGGPTAAADIAAAVAILARRMTDDPAVGGTFHFAGTPATTWCGFARAVFDERRRLTGAPPPRVDAIATVDYPTPARRPANSVLDVGRIAAVCGIAAPDWRPALAAATAELLGISPAGAATT